MSYPVDNTEDSTPDPWEETENQPINSETAHSNSNSDSAQESDRLWRSEADHVTLPLASTSQTDNVSEPIENKQPLVNGNLPSQKNRPPVPLAMVETAFLASTASLIWLINYYFPVGPLLRMFFPIPIALVYLRWGNRASWMAALVSGLLLSVLMGPPRSILFFIPYALMGVQLGAMWSRQASWLWSILTGALLGAIGFFFRFWLLSILLGEDLWVYVMTQITELLEWGFVKLGLLAQPSLLMIQIFAVLMILFSNLVYVFVVHLIALLMLDKLGNPIPRPPNWVQVLLDYDG